MPLIHPTAVVSAEAKLADGVRVGAYAVIDGPVTLGRGCSVAAHAHLIGPLTLGENNTVGTGAVLGGDPQHLAYKGQPTAIEEAIGRGDAKLMDDEERSGEIHDNVKHSRLRISSRA